MDPLIGVLVGLTGMGGGPRRGDEDRRRLEALQVEDRALVPRTESSTFGEVGSARCV
jgi:hypothetical protein